jgi:hypothetical protein
VPQIGLSPSHPYIDQCGDGMGGDSGVAWPVVADDRRHNGSA